MQRKITYVGLLVLIIHLPDSQRLWFPVLCLQCRATCNVGYGVILEKYLSVFGSGDRNPYTVSGSILSRYDRLDRDIPSYSIPWLPSVDSIMRNLGPSIQCHILANELLSD